MEVPSKLTILFIVNPISGGKKKIKWEPIIRNHFKSLDHNIEFFILTGKNDADTIQFWIQKKIPDRVVAVGGDGTVSLVARQLLGLPIPMGILRGGSANGMATELQIPENPSSAIDLIIKGIVSKCDVIKINEEDICIHLSDIGLNARLVKYFENSAFRGMWAYARMFLKILWQGRLMQANIVADNIEINIPAYMIVIANATKYGTGAVINPDGAIHDGKFELVMVRKISFIEIFKMFLSYQAFNPKKVEILHTTHAVITTKRPIHFQVDGEYKGQIRKVSATIIPSALNLIKGTPF